MSLKFDADLIPSDARGVAYAIALTPVARELEKRRAQYDADPDGPASALLRQYVALLQRHVERCESALRLLEGAISKRPADNDDLRVFGATLASVDRSIDAAVGVCVSQSSDEAGETLRLREQVAALELSESFRDYTADMYQRWIAHEAANRDAVPRLRAAQQRLRGDS